MNYEDFFRDIYPEVVPGATAGNALRRTKKSPKNVNALKGRPEMSPYFGNEAMLAQQYRQGAEQLQAPMTMQATAKAY